MSAAVVCNGTKPLLWYSTYGVRRYAYRNTSHAERLDTSKVGIDRGIAEAALFFLWQCVETALCIGCHEQYHPDAHSAPGLQDRLGHGVWVSVRLAAGLVVNVVKLAHAGVASRKHFTIGLQCRIIQKVGIQTLRL